MAAVQGLGLRAPRVAVDGGPRRGITREISLRRSVFDPLLDQREVFRRDAAGVARVAAVAAGALGHATRLDILDDLVGFAHGVVVVDGGVVAAETVARVAGAAVLDQD